MPKTNEAVEDLLTEWAELLQISGADQFRVRAYEKAARAIGGHARDLETLTDKEILSIASVGKNMVARVREYLDTGTIADLEDLREVVPPGLREMTRISGLGPKKAVLLHETLGIASIAELIAALDAGRLRGIKGLGERTEENLRRGIQNLREHGERILIDAAMSVAEQIIASLTERADVEMISYAGSLRRMCETIGDVDILVGAEDSARAMEEFTALEIVDRVIASGETKSSIVTRRGLQVDLRVVPVDAWGAALIYFTGSKAHNIAIREIAVKKGLKLSEWGLFESESGTRIAARTEEEVYEQLGLQWVPPTMRENTGEVEAARAGSLPTPVTQRDITGDLHAHTDMTDGLATLEEMVAAAAARGYTYFTITDHAENLTMTGVGKDKMLEQRARIATLQRRIPGMTLLHGSELNIGKDGTVDYDPEFLSGFDVLVASVHSHFRQSRAETTARLIAAIQNPNVHVIGHPSGRLIGKREPIDFDFEAVCEAAARTGTALEINCFPDRLDLRDEHVRWAIERGVTLTIDTDAHATQDLDHLRFGIATAQRGWARAADVLNARPVDHLRAFVARKRARST